MPVSISEPSIELKADFALMTASPGALNRYFRLYHETSDFISGLKDEAKYRWATWPDLEDADRLKSHLFDLLPPDELDTELAARWEAWGREYNNICRDSPKWRLRMLISDISHVTSGRSWPEGLERDYWHWAMMPNGKAEIHVGVRDDLIDDYRERMRSLITECGGFLHTAGNSAEIIFSRTEDLPSVWEAQNQLLPWERIERYRNAQQKAELAKYEIAYEGFTLTALFRRLSRWLARKIFD